MTSSLKFLYQVRIWTGNTDGNWGIGLLSEHNVTVENFNSVCLIQSGYSSPPWKKWFSFPLTVLQWLYIGNMNYSCRKSGSYFSHLSNLTQRSSRLSLQLIPKKSKIYSRIRYGNIFRANGHVITVVINFLCSIGNFIMVTV